MRPGSSEPSAWVGKRWAEHLASGGLGLAELVDPLLMRGHPFGRMGQRRFQFLHPLQLIARSVMEQRLGPFGDIALSDMERQPAWHTEQVGIAR